MSEEINFNYDPIMGGLNRFLSGSLSFEPETDKPNIWLNKVIPLDIYHSMDPDIEELTQPPQPPPKWVPSSIPLFEQKMYIKFKHKFRHYEHLQEGEILMSFNLAIDVFMFARSLKIQSEECANKRNKWEKTEDENRKKTEDENRKKTEDENRKKKEDENYILIRGRHWEKFNGFMSLRNSVYPTGEFASRGHRCGAFGMLRGLITCYIIDYVKGVPFQCIAELCAHCFWLYRRTQLNTTAKLRLTTEFLIYVYSSENQKNMTPMNYALCQEVPKNLIFPEKNIWFRPADSDQLYGLFPTIKYPKNPPLAIRSFAPVKDWDPYIIHEMEDIVQEQEQMNRKRQHEAAFAYENGIPYEGRKSRSFSKDFDSDIHNIVSDDLEKKPQFRKKTVELEIFNDPKTLPKRSYNNSCKQTRKKKSCMKKSKN
jgi:hypothetical protein